MECGLNNELCSILECVHSEGGRALIVGGWVRDLLIGVDSKDIDIEVFGLPLEKLAYILSAYGVTDIVGKSFGVIKLKLGNEYIDFSVSRRDSKQGKGHNGFITTFDENMSVKEACSRRDFTINAMAFDPLTGELLDYFNGQSDIKEKYLVPTSESFKEDVLRVLRGMQFSARFSFDGSNLLDDYAKEMFDEYKDLPVERVWTEWEKLISKGESISCALSLLKDTSWIKHYPELNNLIDIEQDPVFHPEGKALIHTGFVADEAVAIAKREVLNEFDRKVLILAAICHDLGKANTTVFKENKWRSPGHDVSGVPLTETFLKSIGCPQNIINHVKPLVRWHMAHCRTSFRSKSIRKLSVNMQPSNINMLLLLIEADISGRSPLPKGLPESALKLKEVADRLGVTKYVLRPIIKGKHLIELGLTPSEDFGIIIKQAFDAQIEGIFNTESEAIIWLKGKVF